MYTFQEIPSAKKNSWGMCKNCRYRFYFDPPFGTGWTACRIMTDDEETFANEISGIPLEIRCNCPGFEKKTLLSMFKKRKQRIIYQGSDDTEVDDE